MTEPAIAAFGLSKRYRLGAIGRKTLQDELAYRYHKLRGHNVNAHMGKVARPSAAPKHAKSSSDFWALRDVSFEIQPGETIGVIGRNGSGKSTLLKILSRITEPTEGEAVINGRVGSLLEVGTGFHPELSGRENVFMNGTILGMKRAEISRQFDAIVEFSEIGEFLDTPVKRYSSGMYVRLAFAVAAHLQTDILIVDEVLAVGDAQFQQKCLGKMSSVSEQGRTVLFVSHNMSAVNELCTRSILLAGGKILAQGATEDMCDMYLMTGVASSGNCYTRPDSSPKDVPHIQHAQTIDRNGVSKQDFDWEEPVALELTLNFPILPKGTVVAIVLKDQFGRKLFTNAKESTTLGTAPGCWKVRIQLPPSLLTRGHYGFMIALHVPNQTLFDVLEFVCRFNILDTDSELNRHAGGDHGNFLVHCNWQRIE